MEPINLEQSLNAREKILFVITISAYCLFFTKNCIFANYKLVEDIRTEKIKLINEKNELELLSNSDIKNQQIDTENDGFIIPWSELSKEIINPLHMQGVILHDSRFMENIKNNEKILNSNLNISGNFNSIKKYLSYLESLSIPVNIKKFNLENSGLNDNVISVILEGVSYEKP